MNKKLIAKELITEAKKLMAADVYVQNPEIIKQVNDYADKFEKQAKRTGLYCVSIQFFLERDKCFAYIDFCKDTFLKTRDLKDNGTFIKLNKLVRDMEDARLDIQKQIDMEFD